MLRTFRNNMRSIFGVIIITLACLLMLSFGVGTPSGGGAPQVVATVGDHEISYLDYQRQLQSMRAREQARMGQNFAQMEKFLQLEQRALDSLIQEAVTDSFAQELGFTASIKDIEEQLTQAGINRATFDAFRRSQGLSEAQIESLMRSQIVRMQLATLFSDSSRLSDLELKEVFKEQNTQKKFLFTRVSAEKVQEEVNVEDEEALQAHFSDNLESFREPAKTKFSFITFSPSDFEGEVQVLDEDIEQLYAERKRDFRTPYRIQLKQIQVEKMPTNEVPGEEKPADGNTEDAAAARAKAEEILQKLDDGAEFDSFQPTDMGWSDYDALEPRFKASVVGLNPGEHSQIVDLPKAYYIIQLTAEEKPRVKTLEEVHEEIKSMVKREQAPVYAQASAEDFFSTWKSSGKSLEEFASDKGKTIFSSGKLVSASETVEYAPIGLVDRVLEFAENASGIEVFPSAVVLFHVEAFKESAIPEFSAVKNKVINSYKRDKARELAEDKAKQILAEVRDSEDRLTALRQIADREKLEVEETPAFSPRTANNPLFFNPINRQQAFALREKGKFVSEPLIDAQGSVVLGVSEVIPPNEEDFEAQKKVMAQSESARAGERLFQVLVETLKKEQDIWINPDFLERNENIQV